MCSIPRIVLICALVTISGGVLFGYLVGSTAIYMFLNTLNTDCSQIDGHAACESLQHSNCVWVVNNATGPLGRCLFTDYLTAPCHLQTTANSCANITGCTFDYDKNLCNHSPVWSPTENGVFAAALIVGCLVGSMAASSLAKGAGLKRCLMLSGCIATLATIVVMISRSVGFFWLLVLSRILSGVASGISCVICPMYVGEMTPVAYAGPVGVLFQVAFTFGIFLASALGLIVAPIETQTPLGMESRIQGLMAVQLILSLLPIPIGVVAPKPFSEIEIDLKVEAEAAAAAGGGDNGTLADDDGGYEAWERNRRSVRYDESQGQFRSYSFASSVPSTSASSRKGGLGGPRSNTAGAGGPKKRRAVGSDDSKSSGSGSGSGGGGGSVRYFAGAHTQGEVQIAVAEDADERPTAAAAEASRAEGGARKQMPRVDSARRTTTNTKAGPPKASQQPDRLPDEETTLLKDDLCSEQEMTTASTNIAADLPSRGYSTVDDDDYGTSGSGDGKARVVAAEEGDCRTLGLACVAAVALCVASQMTGINAIMNYAPVITKAAKLPPLLGNFVVTLWNCVTAMLALPLAKKLSPRTLFLGGALVGTAACFLTGIVVYPGVCSTSSTQTVLAALGVLVFILAFEVGMGTSFWIHAQAMFPPQHRGSGCSFTLTVNFILNIIINLCFPVAVVELSGGPSENQNKGMSIVFLGFGVFGVLSLIVLFRVLK